MPSNQVRTTDDDRFSENQSLQILNGIIIGDILLPEFTYRYE